MWARRAHYSIQLHGHLVQVLWFEQVRRLEGPFAEAPCSRRSSRFSAQFRPPREGTKKRKEQVLMPKRAREAESCASSSKSRRSGEAAAPFSAAPNLEELRGSLAAFAAARDWDQFHTPRSLALALTGEVGELCECFQWRGDAACAPGLPGWTDADRTHLGEEMADVLMYLVRLADRSGIDLPAACAAKLERNGQKYPADRCRGSSAKYTSYK